jgi:hypothetical protein
MSQLGPTGRRAEQWGSPHERARVRAAERLEAPLPPSEAAWLEAHLRECSRCAAIADAYATDRAMLRRLRDANPDPPRDLWARTSAAIERESTARGRRRRAVSTPLPSRPAVGALSALAVVGVVLVATALSGGFLGDNGIALASSHPESPAVSLRAAPTAIAVSPGQVRWLGVRDDGVFAYNVATVDAVCPFDRQPDCAPFADGHARPVTLTATPKFVFQSPVADEAVVVGTDAAGADAVIVVSLPASEPSDAPSPTESAVAGSPIPSDSTAPFESAPVASTGTEPSDDPGIQPPPSIAASVEPSDSLPASASPSVEPTAATAVAIITDVTVVGRGAGYSPDGAWFAFSARPADDSAGPDIYVWHVGDPIAVALTTDHASVFASWVGNQLLGSRATPADLASPGATASADPSVSLEPSPTPDPTPTPTPSPTPDGSPVVDASASPEPTPAPEFVAQTFLIDPLTGIETPMLGADWHPVVDPTGVWVVAWEGTVREGPDGRSLVPATGRLVVHAFRALLDLTASPDPSGLPGESPVVQPSDLPTDQPVLPTDGSPVPTIGPTFEPQVIAEGPVAEFDARWDDTGTWLAIWVADPVDPSIGRLSLLHVDPTTGVIDRPLGSPQDVPALPGFSIGAGRLAWATPPGQGGEGSRIQIVAWTEDAVGAIESIPVEGAIVVQ